MPLVLADRVQETTATTGTGTITLAGAVTQYQSFAAGVGSGNSTYYCLLSGNGTDWETGTGTLSGSGPYTLSRTVNTSSNSNALISLTGTSTVYCTQPANKIITNGGLGNLTQLAFNSTGASSSITGVSQTFYQSTTSVSWSGYGVMKEIAARIRRENTTDQPAIALSNNGGSQGIVMVAQNDGNLVIYRNNGSTAAVAAGNSGGYWGGGSTQPTVHNMKLFASSVNSFPSAVYYGSRDNNGTGVGVDTDFDLTTGTWYIYVSANSFADIQSVVINTNPEYGS